MTIDTTWTDEDFDQIRMPNGLFNSDLVPDMPRDELIKILNRINWLNCQTLLSCVYRDAEALAKERDCDTMDLDPIRDGFLSRVADAVFTAYNIHHASVQAWSALETAREMLGQEFDSSLVFAAHRYRYEVKS